MAFIRFSKGFLHDPNKDLKPWILQFFVLQVKKPSSDLPMIPQLTSDKRWNSNVYFRTINPVRRPELELQRTFNGRLIRSSAYLQLKCFSISNLKWIKIIKIYKFAVIEILVASNIIYFAFPLRYFHNF